MVSRMVDMSKMEDTESKLIEAFLDYQLAGTKKERKIACNLLLSLIHKIGWDTSGG